MKMSSVKSVKPPRYCTRPRTDSVKQRKLFDKLLDESLSRSRIYLDGFRQKNLELVQALLESRVVTTELKQRVSVLQARAFDFLTEKAILRKQLTDVNKELATAKETINDLKTKLSDLTQSQACQAESVASTSETKTAIAIPRRAQRTGILTGCAKQPTALRVAIINTTQRSADKKQKLLNIKTEPLSPLTEFPEVGQDSPEAPVSSPLSPKLEFVTFRRKLRVKLPSTPSRHSQPPKKDNLDKDKENPAPVEDRTGEAEATPSITGQEPRKRYNLRRLPHRVIYAETNLRQKVRKPK